MISRVTAPTLRRHKQVCAAAVVGATLAACGTTVPLTERVPSSNLSGGVETGGAGVRTPNADSGPGSAPLGSGKGIDSGRGPAPLASGTAVDAAVGSAPLPSGAAGASGPLFPSVVKVGLQYSDNGSTALAAAGSSNTAIPDTRPIDKAVIAYVNAQGGVAGRRLVPVFNKVDATASPVQQSAQSCTQWTQDDKVTVALPNSPFEDNANLRTCLGTAGVPALYFNLYASTTVKGFAQQPLWAENISTSLESYAKTYVKGLKAQGFFEGGKVGVVYFDGPDFMATLNNTLLPALRVAGVTPETYGTHISGSSDLAAGSSGMQSAVLNFRSKGVNRVLFFEPWVGYFAFMQAAQSQAYHPRYGLTSQESVQVALDLGLVPRAQLDGANLVSWLTIVDVPLARAVLGPRERLCRDIMRKGGVPLYSDQTSYAGQMSICESILRLRDVYMDAPGRLVGSDFARGLEQLGTTAQYATIARGSFSSSKHWGLSVYYDGKYDSGCGCFTVGAAPHAMS